MHLPPTVLQPCIPSIYPLHPVADDRVHHHIKYGGGQQVALRDPPVTCEWGAVVAPCLGYHDESH